MKPILFNTRMTKAILENRKTVTRRVINAKVLDGLSMEEMHERAPYKVDEVLYVRETFCWCPCWDCGMDTEEHNCCDKTANKFFNHSKGEWGCYGYKASFEDNEYPSVDKWHPSIHMPKEVARIFLKVTDVRVERLQEMDTVDDQEFLKEGAVDKHNFIEIWDDTVKEESHSWYGNPYVWVLEFERITKEQAYEIDRQQS